MNFTREKHHSCPICNSVNFKILGKKYGKIVKEEFEVARCDVCDLIFITNPIHRQHLHEIYSEEYFSGSGLDDSVNYAENLNRPDFFYAKYDWQIGNQLRQYSFQKNINWLDVGCALGNVLDWAKLRYEANTFGIELSNLGRDKCNQKNHKIIGSTIEEVNEANFNEKFDIITAYEVIEHLYEPMNFFNKLPKLLKENGVFHYSTGNPPRDPTRILDWQYIRPEVHIVFYSPRCMNWIFEKINLKVNQRKHFPFNMNNSYIPPTNWKQKIIYFLCWIGIDLLGTFQPDGRKVTYPQQMK